MSPDCPREFVTLLRVTRVSGCSGPSTRTWSGSSAAYSRGVFGGRTAGITELCAPVCQLTPCVKCVGVIGAEPPRLLSKELFVVGDRRRVPGAALPVCQSASGCEGFKIVDTAAIPLQCEQDLQIGECPAHIASLRFQHGQVS